MRLYKKELTSYNKGYVKKATSSCHELMSIQTKMDMGVKQKAKLDIKANITLNFYFCYTVVILVKILFARLLVCFLLKFCPRKIS